MKFIFELDFLSISNLIFASLNFSLNFSLLFSLQLSLQLSLWLSLQLQLQCHLKKFFISISPQISLQCHFNFHLSSQSNINDVVILLQTTADNSWHLFTFQFPLTFHNNTTCYNFICKKKIWKEHFLLKYIIFMHLYNCWCISFLYRHIKKLRLSCSV